MWIREEKEKIDNLILRGSLQFEMNYPKEVGISHNKVEVLMDYLEENEYRCLPIETNSTMGFKAVKIIENDVI